MPKHRICDCTDWHIEDHQDHMVFRPSLRTAKQRLAVTVVAVVFLGLLMLTFGFPPGSRGAGQQQRRIERLERHLGEVQKRHERTRISDSRLRDQVLRAQESELAAAQMMLEAERARPQDRRATLGRAGDAVYWTVFGLLLAAGVLAPVSGVWERITLDGRFPGELHVRPRGQIVRSCTLHTADCGRMEVLVEQVAWHGRRCPPEMRGWRWCIVLFSRERPDEPLLEVWPEQEPTLPPQVQRLTPRVRQTVAFLQRVTGLAPEQVRQVEVLDVRPGLMSTRYRVGMRSHGAPEPPRRRE